MKKLFLSLAVIASVSLFSCANKADKEAEATEADATEVVEEAVVACDSCVCDTCVAPCDTCAAAAVVEEGVAAN